MQWTGIFIFRLHLHVMYTLLHTHPLLFSKTEIHIIFRIFASKHRYMLESRYGIIHVCMV